MFFLYFCVNFLFWLGFYIIVYVQPLDSYSYNFKLLINPYINPLYHSLCFTVICLMLLYTSYLVPNAAPLKSTVLHCTSLLGHGNVISVRGYGCGSYLANNKRYCPGIDQLHAVTKEFN